MPQSIATGLTKAHIDAALADLSAGVPHPFGKPTKFELIHGSNRYPPKAVVGIALQRLLGRAIVPSEFSGGDGSGQANYVLRRLGYTVRPIANPTRDALVDEERKRRHEMWEQIVVTGGPSSVTPELLRRLRAYGGAQGIWVDKSCTERIHPGGITVALLHTGRSYADDFGDDDLIYHFPRTRRPGGRDTAEINATRAAGEFRLPVFVISHSGTTRRSVCRGWVESWDDEAGTFLITFQPTSPDLRFADVEDEVEFSLTASQSAKRYSVKARPGQQRFKFGVLRRYGSQCAVCDIRVPQLLEAAHICSKEWAGSDDPRNGLLLCASHHKAFDAGLFSIDPDTLGIKFSIAMNAMALGIKRECLSHLMRKPHLDALRWRFNTRL